MLTGLVYAQVSLAIDLDLGSDANAGDTEVRCLHFIALDGAGRRCLHCRAPAPGNNLHLHRPQLLRVRG